jgi:hypothetical protein
MGRTYAAKRRTLLKKGNKHILTVCEKCGFKPGTCKSTRRGAEFYFTYLENEVYSRNDVTPSVGREITSERVEKAGVSSICHSVEACVILAIYKPSFGVTEKTLIFV